MSVVERYCIEKFGIFEKWEIPDALLVFQSKSVKNIYFFICENCKFVIYFWYSQGMLTLYFAREQYNIIGSIVY